jgi:hypothetical protein
MKFILPIIALSLTSGCIKKTNSSTQEIQIIERDTDILDEEDLEELPES